MVRTIDACLARTPILLYLMNYQILSRDARKDFFGNNAGRSNNLSAEIVPDIRMNTNLPCSPRLGEIRDYLIGPARQRRRPLSVSDVDTVWTDGMSR
jgi:hypothetical protein